MSKPGFFTSLWLKAQLYGYEVMSMLHDVWAGPTKYCDVCNKYPATYGGIVFDRSFSYCKRCFIQGAEPWDYIVNAVATEKMELCDFEVQATLSILCKHIDELEAAVDKVRAYKLSWGND